MMTNTDDFDRFQSDVADLYCGGSETGVDAVARTHGVSPDQVLLELSRFAATARFVREAPQQEPSSWSLNKIMAHAREAAERNRQPFFARWRFAAWFGPLLAGATAAALFFELQTPIQTVQTQENSQQVARVVAPAQHRNSSELFASFLRNHPFMTSLDQQDPNNRPLNSGVSIAKNVNFSDLPAALNNDDDSALSDRMLSGSLSDHDVEILYLRARQSETLGNYQSALRDYEVIARFHPDFGAYQSVPVAMARCLTQLDRKQDAVALLKKYESAYGRSEKLDLWIDQLRSVSF